MKNQKKFYKYRVDGMGEVSYLGSEFLSECPEPARDYYRAGGYDDNPSYRYSEEYWKCFDDMSEYEKSLVSEEKPNEKTCQK